MVPRNSGKISVMWKNWKKPSILILTVLLAAISASAVLHAQTKQANPIAAIPAFTACGPPKHITLADLEALTTNTIIPDRRSLSPPCSITYNGATYPTYVELDAMTIQYTPFTGDCNADVQNYCDVHLEFGCTISAGCLFEIDQYWFAAGYQYPVNTQGIGSVSPGTVVNATGFLYLDEHGIHELHPVASVSVYRTPPPTCNNGTIDPPQCVTCNPGYVMVNGMCTIQQGLTNHPPVLTLPPDQTVTAGKGISFDLSATDPDPGQQVFVTATGMPPASTFDSSTLVFNWTPSTSQVGNYTLVFLATDTGTPPMTVSKYMTVHVEPASSNGSGGPGGAGGGSSSSGFAVTCWFCGSMLRPSINMLGFVFAGAVGLLLPMLLMSVRSRSVFQRVKRRLLGAARAR